jgi:hypothetical protein
MNEIKRNVLFDFKKIKFTHITEGSSIMETKDTIYKILTWLVVLVFTVIIGIPFFYHDFSISSDNEGDIFT